MEPWSFSYGHKTPPPPPTPSSRTFKVAIAFQPWIRRARAGSRRQSGPLQRSHDLSAMDTAAAAARPDGLHQFSMEPWPLSHGYPPGPKRTKIARSIPSMEPWPLSHGYLAVGGFGQGVFFPSMEPWPLSHGYWPRWPRWSWAARWTFNGAMASQPWIQDFLIYKRTETVVLQWSHGLSAMDTRLTSG